MQRQIQTPGKLRVSDLSTLPERRVPSGGDIIDFYFDVL